MINSNITEVIYKTLKDLYECGLMTDEEMREVDQWCMPHPITKQEDKPAD